jgi:2-dehydro-3-deoxygluconokinase
MYDVVCFGEAMIRFTPNDFERLEQVVSLRVSVGGSELSAAVGLARLGMRAAWVSKLTSNGLGRIIANQARAHGVDISHVVWTDDYRVGLYFVEPGASPRASQVLYDRKDAAIAHFAPTDVDWDEVLRGVRAFHVSGITPALSDLARQSTVAAIAAAKRQGCMVSFDVNFRARLWSAQAAGACLSQLMPAVDVLISTSDDLETVFGCRGSEEEMARQMKERFGHTVVAMTIRQAPTVLHGFWSSIAVADQVHRGRVTELELVDRVGSGDAYTAGFLFGYLTGDVAKAVAYGDAMSVLKHSIPGDLSYFTAKEVEAATRTVATKIQR